MQASFRMKNNYNSLKKAHYITEKPRLVPKKAYLRDLNQEY